MVGQWVLGGLVGIAGIVGLQMAATIHQPGFYTLGLGIAGGAVVYIAFLIKRACDRAERGDR
ncbi:hypothetical protein STVA_47550 [Allostella vacuolata]|nr:hypothetical protein STVA_47550 [Stella vacuolata]